MKCPVLLDEGSPLPAPELAALLDPYSRYIPVSAARIRRKQIHRKSTDDGRPRCTWCGGSVPPPKQTFCGPECVREWTVRRQGAYVRVLVFERDGGVCSSCELDTSALSNTFRRLYWQSLFDNWSKQRAGQDGWREAWERERQQIAKAREEALGCVDAFWSKYLPGLDGYSKSLWEADHVLEVCRGGGQCGISNYQTLCLKCHAGKTKALYVP